MLPADVSTTSSTTPTVLDKHPSSALTSSDTDLSEASATQRRHRRRLPRHRSSLGNLAKGRVLAPGAFVGTNQWQLTHKHRRGLLGGTKGRVTIHSELVHAEFYCHNPRNDTFVVRDAAGRAILQCTTASTSGDKKKYILYGSRPLKAGNPPSNKIGGVFFYPWYQVALGGDGSVSVEIFQCTDALLWYCDEPFQQADDDGELNFKSIDDETAVAGNIARDGADSQVVTVNKPGADPAVMIAIALLRFQI